MNTLRLLFVLFFLLGALLLFQQKTAKSENASLFPTPVLSPSPIEISEQKESTDSPPPTSESVSEEPFQYPNAEVTKIEKEKVSMETTDTPEQVTAWYKAKIVATNMRQRTTVQTSTNGEVLNKLSAVKEDISVTVEIRREENSEKTKIVVSVKTS